MENKLSTRARDLLKSLRENAEGETRVDENGQTWLLVHTSVAADSGVPLKSIGGLFSKLRKAGVYQSLDIANKWGEVTDHDQS